MEIDNQAWTSIIKRSGTLHEEPHREQLTNRVVVLFVKLYLKRTENTLDALDGILLVI